MQETPKKILLVDDDPDLMKMVATRLAETGCEVLTADSGEMALRLAREKSPDLIVLDVTMPPPNGYQVCRVLREDPRFKEVPIIFLTARSEESDQFWGMESGADAYVTKPFHAEELLSKVSNFLGV